MIDEKICPSLLRAGMEWSSDSNESHDFPAVTEDVGEGVWLAVLVHADKQRFVRVTRLFGDNTEEAIDLDLPGTTGMGPMAICATTDGCVVAIPVEQDKRWRIACFFLDRTNLRKSTPVFLDAGGSVNCTPALAAIGQDIHVVWQGNAGKKRAIYSTVVSLSHCSRIVCLSSVQWNSQNPAIIDLGDGEGFAVWDSMRGDSADIFGARLKDEIWGSEERLTSDARIERHACLATHNGEVWMAWQAQAYEERRLNHVTEQRIVIGRIDAAGVTMLPGQFEDISPEDALLVRPLIAFDSDGRLWLSYRRSRGQLEGWIPEIRVYDGQCWSPPEVPTKHDGRWRPIPLTPLGDCMLWTCQCDDLPCHWNEMGNWPDWHSWIEVSACQIDSATPSETIATEHLAMPKTTFSLAKKRTLCAAALPEQHAHIGESESVLMWGVFHEHTDLSVCRRSTNPTGLDLFANVRDIEQLDFCALTDHGYNFDPAQWAFNGEQTRMYHDQGRFVTFLGQEWTSDAAPPLPDGKMNRYGHRNLVYLDPYHPHYYDAHDGDISPTDLWGKIGNVDFLCIPHQLACWDGEGKNNVPVQWDYHDERIQPVAEICQSRGSYEGLGCPYPTANPMTCAGHFLQDAWARGLVIGVIGSPEHGGGKGKIGVWAPTRTREDIFAAIRARHTFGTSGPKMSLLVRSGEAIMGDLTELSSKDSLQFTVDAICLRKIKELSILRNNEVVFQSKPNQAELHLEWEDTDPLTEHRTWYYVRLTTGADEWAWSSPIWFI